MLIRKPVQEVFEAMVHPDITSQFWLEDRHPDLLVSRNG